MFKKVMVANRGEIACRIIRSLKRMGITSVAVYSEADADAPHVVMADEAYCIGPAPAKDSYLNSALLLEVMKEHGVEAVHPGYGFLSENVEFSRSCKDNGIVFIGPAEEHILEFGLKHRARAIAEEVGVPLVPGTGLLPDLESALAAAERIGYPVMLKSTAGGGGIGMKICRNRSELENSYLSTKRLAENYFKNSGMFLEKYIEFSRHIEVQVFGDGEGNVVTLGERDCSVQRRNQKVIEETPAPNLAENTRHELHEMARRLAARVSYRSAGTVEFIYDTRTGAFYFLEVNTRLQVEHGVTEAVFGIDLVRWMIELAAGMNPIAGKPAFTPSGSAMEFRLYAEDPGKGYQPSSGIITQAVLPLNTRCDTWIETGTEITSYYDPLLAKVIVKGSTREETVMKGIAALENTRISGFETNLILLRQILRLPAFVRGEVTTRMLDGLVYSAPTFEVVQPGMQTTVQSVPGRLGYWAVGVPPSGPMDPLHFRLANKLVGNKDDASGLEWTHSGGSYRFNTDTVIAIAGGRINPRVNGISIPMFEAVEVHKGDLLETGTLTSGQRAYLAVRGGVDVPEYLGSGATFLLGKFGGHGGRALTAGDILHIGDKTAANWTYRKLDPALHPALPSHWEIGVMNGPHGAPEFFTKKDIETLFSIDWEVHYNSSRTGVRLIGPAPEWARRDGGEAGLHPSNIHDNAYAVGTIDYTGDMPIIIGPDGPSLGGFVCPITIVQAELWKTGQMRAGDTVRFRPVSEEEAAELEAQQDNFINTLELPRTRRYAEPETGSGAPAIVKTLPEHEVVYRRAGDKYLLIEYGALQIDIEMRFRVHRLESALEKKALPGMIDMTAGIRSLQLHYDSRVLPLKKLLETLETLEKELAADPAPRRVPSRILHIPLSWDDPCARAASEKYMKVVRANAPWCPDNIEFIRRINGLPSIDAVQNIIFDAEYLVMGLGDVYLGAPVAVSRDPRHRLVTTKYNPARTWTAENSVGIGGAYMGIYGMEGPGGYQLFGRTIQTWNTYRKTAAFPKPWFYRSFDVIRFYPVSHDELMKMRRAFLRGTYCPKIEESVFDLDAHLAFLNENDEGIRSFKARQQTAFEAERQDWVTKGLLNFQTAESANDEETSARAVIPEGSSAVSSPVSGMIWKLLVKEGQQVSANQPVAVIECMKTEITTNSPFEGVVSRIFGDEGSTVRQGQELLAVEPVACLAAN